MRRKGFTLMEGLVMIAISVIIAAVIFPVIAKEWPSIHPPAALGISIGLGATVPLLMSIVYVRSEKKRLTRERSIGDIGRETINKPFNPGSQLLDDESYECTDRKHRR